MCSNPWLKGDSEHTSRRCVWSSMVTRKILWDSVGDHREEAGVEGWSNGTVLIKGGERECCYIACFSIEVPRTALLTTIWA